MESSRYNPLLVLQGYAEKLDCWSKAFSWVGESISLAVAGGGGSPFTKDTTSNLSLVTIL